jgi:hypothetical protein
MMMTIIVDYCVTDQIAVQLYSTVIRVVFRNKSVYASKHQVHMVYIGAGKWHRENYYRFYQGDNMAVSRQ